MKRKIVPDIVKPREIISVSRDDKIIDATAKMADAHVAALVVFDDKENLVGIVTERDMTHRVVAKGEYQLSPLPAHPTPALILAKCKMRLNYDRGLFYETQNRARHRQASRNHLRFPG